MGLLHLHYAGAVDPTTYLDRWRRVEHVTPLPPAELPARRGSRTARAPSATTGSCSPSAGSAGRPTAMPFIVEPAAAGRRRRCRDARTRRQLRSPDRRSRARRARRGRAPDPAKTARVGRRRARRRTEPSPGSGSMTGMRQRATWWLVVPILVVGEMAGHSLAYRIVAPDAAERGASARADRDTRTSRICTRSWASASFSPPPLSSSAQWRASAAAPSVAFRRGGSRCCRRSRSSSRSTRSGSPTTGTSSGARSRSRRSPSASVLQIPCGFVALRPGAGPAPCGAPGRTRARRTRGRRRAPVR